MRAGARPRRLLGWGGLARMPCRSRWNTWSGGNRAPLRRCGVVDGLFIRNLTHEHDNQVFVRAIIDLARGLGRRTVAEFVESQEILDMLKTLGVDMVQGYHLDQPQAEHPALATSAV